MAEKYLISFRVPQPQRSKILRLISDIQDLTNLPAPKLGPHVTFHRPIKGISEKRLLSLTESVSLKSVRTRIVVSGVISFGKHYIVMPVHATRSAASLWVGISDLVSQLPEYEHGEFDHDNTLHITLAEKTAQVFDKIWPRVKELSFDPIEIPLTEVELLRKDPDHSHWQTVRVFQIPKY